LILDQNGGESFDPKIEIRAVQSGELRTKVLKGTERGEEARGVDWSTLTSRQAMEDS
jgi:hypothetical protein